MASANSNGLAIIYGGDILGKVKGSEFYFKQSVQRKVSLLEKETEFILKDLVVLC